MLNISARAAPLVRKVCTSAVRQSHVDNRGVVGSNLPFDIHNKYKFTLWWILYMGSGLGIPFFALRHSLLKGKSG